MRVHHILPLFLVVLAGAGPAAQQTAVSPLPMQDYIEIQQLYSTYNVALDRGDSEAWASTFTADGTFSGATGHDALVGWANNYRDKSNGLNRRHFISNFSVTRTNDGTTGSVYLALLDVSVRPVVPVVTGIYQDVLVKTPQGWRFKSRVVRPDPAPAKSPQ